MGFQFSLQRLLDMRRDEVQACEQQVEESRRILALIKQQLAEQLEAYFAERNDLNACIAQGALERVTLFEGSLEMRKQRMLACLQQQRNQEEEVSMAEQCLIQARRNCKAVENLHDKRRAEYQRKEDQRESKFLDEQATLRHLRRESSRGDEQ